MNYWKLLVAIVICQVAGLIGAFFNSFSIKSWYPNLVKPAFLPPSWLFPVVWSILFVIIGVSLYLILVSNNKTNLKKNLWIFSIQLLLNILWSFFFFTLQSPLLGLIEIIILNFAIVINIIYFYKTSKAAAYLLLPYLLWVLFATILTISIFILN